MKEEERNRVLERVRRMRKLSNEIEDIMNKVNTSDGWVTKE